MAPGGAQYAPTRRQPRLDIVNKALLLGYGYVARRFASLLIADRWSVRGTIRRPAQADALAADRVEPFLWTKDGLDEGALDGAAALLISTPPSDDGCPAYGAVREAIAERARSIGWIGYLSTNGVYGDYGGAVVTERSVLRATSPRGKNRIAAEGQWAALAHALKIPLAIFRLPGIYGPGRSALDTVREGRAQRIEKTGQVFSRAHVDDIAAALRQSLADPGAGDLFNIADDEPAPPQDVIGYACALLGVAPPPLVAIEDAQLSEMARSFYADNKRVSNALMKARLLPALRYPTYREGLRAILEAERTTGIRG